MERQLFAKLRLWPDQDHVGESQARRLDGAFDLRFRSAVGTHRVDHDSDRLAFTAQQVLRRKGRPRKRAEAAIHHSREALFFAGAACIMQEWTVLRGDLTDYLVSTERTSRPLYCPHFGQARCGILRS